MNDVHYINLLATHLSMNRQTWVTLQRHGVTEATQVRLDFSYCARDRKAANLLRTLIRDETDYDVRVATSPRGDVLVEGSTQKTAISPTVLDQWVTWMVDAGKRCGCDFDGWGTPV